MTSEMMVGCNLKIYVGAFLRLCHLSCIVTVRLKDLESVLVFIGKSGLKLTISVFVSGNNLSGWCISV